jgi:hypothetical protein
VERLATLNRLDDVERTLYESLGEEITESQRENKHEPLCAWNRGPGLSVAFKI